MIKSIDRNTEAKSVQYYCFWSGVLVFVGILITVITVGSIPHSKSLVTVSFSSACDLSCLQLNLYLGDGSTCTSASDTFDSSPYCLADLGSLAPERADFRDCVDACRDSSLTSAESCTSDGCSAGVAFKNGLPFDFGNTTLGSLVTNSPTRSPSTEKPSFSPTPFPSVSPTSFPTTGGPSSAPTTAVPTMQPSNSFYDQSQATSTPNIILVFLDDLGVNMMDTPQGRAAGLYDARPESIKTPEMSRLGSEGVFFLRNVASTPVCMPSRYALLSGISAGSKWSRIRGNTGAGYDGYFNSGGEISVAQELKRRGYSTALFGKYHFQTAPSANGWDYALHFAKFTDGSEYPRYFPEVLYEDTGSGNVARRDLTPANNELGIKSYAAEHNKCTGEGDKCDYAPDIYHNESLKWMQEQVNLNKPFFCYLPMLAPHDGKRASSLGYHTLPVPRIDGPVEDYSQSTYDGYFGRMKNLASSITNYADVHIGEIRDFVLSWGIENNTIIIVTSDNGGTDAIASSTSEKNKILTTSGGYRANYPFRGKKRHLLLGGSAVPTLIWWPNTFAAGRTLTTPTDMTDITKTILDIANVPDILDQFNGVSFLDDIINIDDEFFSSPLVQRQFIFNEICLNDAGILGQHSDCDFAVTLVNGECSGMRIEWTRRTSYDVTIQEYGQGFTSRDGGMLGNLTGPQLSINGYVPFCTNLTLDITEEQNKCSSGQITSDIEACIDLAETIIIAHRIVPTVAEQVQKQTFAENYEY